jgi:PhnB protein
MYNKGIVKTAYYPRRNAKQKMSTINPYLAFNGNCREAMVFYKNCLGGKLHFQTMEDSLSSETMPAKMKKCILYAVLTKKNLVLMGSDMLGEKGLLKGNTVFLVLNCSSAKEVKDCYKKLSQGGYQTHPLQNTLWGVLFGELTDRYGNRWLLNYKKI